MKNKVTIIILLVAFIIVLISISNSLQNKKNDLSLSKNIHSETYSENVLTVTESNFETEVLNSDKNVLIDFYADWCQPCKMLSPLIEEIANENKEIKFVKINVDEESKLATKYNIMYMPTLVMIENGEEIERSIGYIEKNEIEKLIEK